MSDRVVPTGMSATLTLAAITWKRMFRGRALWVAAAIAALPVVFAGAMRARQMSGSQGLGEDLFAFEETLLALIPGMFVAASIGEDIEDRTATYLWSRPIARWAVLAGKLVALAPMVMTIMVASWYLAASSALAVAPSLASCIALAVGALAMCLVSAGITTLVPKHGMALTFVYMIVDMALGAIPASLRQISVTHEIRVIAGWTDETSLAQAGITLAVIAGLWASIALLRIRRIEA